MKSEMFQTDLTLQLEGQALKWEEWAEGSVDLSDVWEDCAPEMLPELRKLDDSTYAISLADLRKMAKTQGVKLGLSIAGHKRHVETMKPAVKLVNKLLEDEHPDDMMTNAEVKQETVAALKGMRRLLHNASVMMSLADISQMDDYPGRSYAALGRSAEVANEIINTAIQWAESMPEDSFVEGSGGQGEKLYGCVALYYHDYHES